MPPARRKTTANRCAYQENGRRCSKPGHGNPPLCPVHRLAIEDAARPQSAIVDVLKDLFGNRRPNAERVVDAVGEVLGSVFAGAAVHEARRQQGVAPSSDDFRPFWPFHPPFREARRAPPPPPAPPPLEQQALHRARRALGFTNGEQLSVDLVKERKRKLARKNHPDLGGSTAKMAEINAAADLLIDSLSPKTQAAGVG